MPKQRTAKPTPLPAGGDSNSPPGQGEPYFQWRWFDNVEGWSEEYFIGILFALIGDTPRVIGLQIAPRSMGTELFQIRDRTHSFELPRSLMGQAWVSSPYAMKGRPLEDFGEPFERLVLTTNELQTIPLQSLANTAWDAFCEDIVAREDALVASISEDKATKWERAAAKHDPRAVVTVADVARIYLEASGRNPREVVAKQLSIGLRTVDRYIKKAREQGLLPPVHPNAMRDAQARAHKSTTRKGQLHAKGE